MSAKYHFMSPYWTAQTQSDTNIINKVLKIAKVKQFTIIMPKEMQTKCFTTIQPKTLGYLLDMVRKVAK